MENPMQITKTITVIESASDKVYEPLKALKYLMSCNLCNLICNLPKKFYDIRAVLFFSAIQDQGA